MRDVQILRAQSQHSAYHDPAMRRLPCDGTAVSSQLTWQCGVQVPEAAGGVAKFGFLDLCGHPLGAADYMALARRFHTVFITGCCSDITAALFCTASQAG